MLSKHVGKKKEKQPKEKKTLGIYDNKETKESSGKRMVVGRRKCQARRECQAQEWKKGKVEKKEVWRGREK
jgi:hypothetical protein